ncbi:RNA methyltransferase [Sulfurimonas sp. MAG313]|nr:RNA methyltransferase [Sulfurimonas sp. MAG313]MDF1879891.1 RNA methyltransferase [Sulfurimonas sp. MAG313]
MNYIPITDLNLPSLLIYKQLRDKAFTNDNSFIADSPKVINKLLKSDLEVKSILATQEYYDEFHDLVSAKNISHLYLADKSLMQEIVGHKVHHNAMMHGIRPANISLENLGSHIIMLDEISSTENIGSIARSAAALGVTSYLLPSQGPHPYQRRALRVSMGHISLLDVHIYHNIFETISTLQKKGYHILAAEVTKESISLAQIKVPDKWVLLMGHEGKGISQDILNVCNQVVKIEMEDGIKSFNVAVAASIMMYHFRNTSKALNIPL